MSSMFNANGNLPPARTPGSFRRLSLTEKENELFLTLLSKNFKTLNFDVLYNLFDERFLFFLDLFEGSTIEIPRRRELEKIIMYTRVYNYLQARSFSDESLNLASKIYEVSPQEIDRIIMVVEDLLSNEEVE